VTGSIAGAVEIGRIVAVHARRMAALDTVANLSGADAARVERLARELGAPPAEAPDKLVDAGVGALVIAASIRGHATFRTRKC
jgi:hypothetical protein